MEQFREARAPGLEFGEVSQETEPQSYSPHISKHTQEGPSEEESSEEGETIILEASHMNLSIDFGDKADQAQGEVVTSLEDAAQTAEAEVELESVDDPSDVTLVQAATPFFNQKTKDSSAESSQESEPPTIAMPTEDIYRASAEFEKESESGQRKDPIFSGENPSTTLPEFSPLVITT